MDRIPTELIINSLEYLSRRDLRAVASVSRRLYGAAQDAGCCILRRIQLGGPGGQGYALEIFNAVVEHALAKPACVRPGIALRLFVHDTPALEGLETTFERILETIKKALPLFVALDVYVPVALTDTLHSALCTSAAPRLRSLVLAQVNDAVSRAIAPPANLFAQTAPRLRTICLGLPTLDIAWPPVFVFQHVVEAHLVLYRPTPPVVVSALLPHVQALIITLEWHKSSVLSPTKIDLSGLSLRYLVLGGSPQMSCEISGIDPSGIPIIETGIGGRFTESFADTAAPPISPISMCIGNSRNTFGTLVRAISLGGQGWKRVAYHATFLPVLEAQTMTGLAMRITLVSVDSLCLSMFLGTPIVLPALAEFALDVSMGGGLSHLDRVVYRDSARLRCPALKSVTLFARGHLFEIRAETVAALGQMLRQEERLAERRAILKLVQVRFLQPTPRKHLESVDRVFPIIQAPSHLDPEILRLYDCCYSQVKASLVPYTLVRHPYQNHGQFVG